ASWSSWASSSLRSSAGAPMPSSRGVAGRARGISVNFFGMGLRARNRAGILHQKCVVSVVAADDEPGEGGETGGPGAKGQQRFAGGAVQFRQLGLGAIEPEERGIGGLVEGQVRALALAEGV